MRNFLKNINWNLKLFNKFNSDKVNYISDELFISSLKGNSYLNREITITTLKDVNEIVSLINFWNKIDNENNLTFAEKQPIKIFINCYCVHINDALTLVDCIKLSSTPVYTINIGTVQKESILIYLAGHKRYSYPRASFLLTTDFRMFDIKEDTEFSNYNSFYELISNEIKDFILETTHITENEYIKKPDNWWLTAEKAYELKICHEVIRTKMI